MDSSDPNIKFDENNICDYCGFSLGNDIPRKTLNPAEILKEAGILKSQGFEHLLLVTGESNRKVGVDYIQEALRILRRHFANLSIEVQPLRTKEYAKLIDAGMHAVMVYQETYERESYAAHHLKGKKKNFDWRLETPDRLGMAGVNKIGLGCLFGITKDWRTDAYFAGLHLDYLEKKYWKTLYSMSFPRIRPYEGETKLLADLTDRDLVQLLCALAQSWPARCSRCSTRTASRTCSRSTPTPRCRSRARSTWAAACLLM